MVLLVGAHEGEVCALEFRVGELEGRDGVLLLLHDLLGEVGVARGTALVDVLLLLDILVCTHLLCGRALAKVTEHLCAVDIVQALQVCDDHLDGRHLEGL